MVIVINQPKIPTFQQAYYECMIECNQAISNSLITCIVESSSDTQILTESFKSVISNIWNGIINAIKNFFKTIKDKFNNLKSKFKNKEVSSKIDSCVSKIEDCFEAEKEDIEKIRDQDITVTVDPAFVQAVKQKAEKKSKESIDALRKETQNQWKDFYSSMNNMFGEVSKQRDQLKDKREQLDKTMKSTFSSIDKSHEEFNEFLAQVKKESEESDKKAEEDRAEIARMLKDLGDDLDSLL